MTITYTENDYATETAVGRMHAYKKGNMLFLNGNFSLSAVKGASTGDTEVARIAGWSAVSPAYALVPCQIDGSKIAIMAVSEAGVIRVNNSMSLSTGFYRFAISVPTA